LCLTAGGLWRHRYVRTNVSKRNEIKKLASLSTGEKPGGAINRLLAAAF